MSSKTVQPIIAIIPARYDSSRFPGKPLALLCGKPMIQWVYERTVAADCVDEVYIATDDEKVEQCVSGFGGKPIMTSVLHKSGSDRLSEASSILGLSDDSIILNIQGDEPVIRPEMINELSATVNQSDCPMGTLCEKFSIDDDISDPNIVKVVTNMKGEALYFSRSVIPYYRDKNATREYYRHVGVYAYRAGFLREMVSMPSSRLERAEGLEQLRVLDNGYKIMVKKTSFHSFGIDTPEQLTKLENKIKKGDLY